MTAVVDSAPTSLIIKHGQDKIILKEIAKGRLPESIIHRPKSGMRIPVYHWFRGPLKSFAKKILNKKRIREAGIFDENRIQEIINMSTEESGSRYGIWLWMIITFEIWRIQTIENEQI